jgi:DNA-binding NtrC family response regulator
MRLRMVDPQGSEDAAWTKPRQEPRRVAAHGHAWTRAVQGRVGGRILIVDEDRDGATLLSGALRRRGYGVEWVTSGTEALRWLETGSVDLVLAHLRMAGMSGVELCEAMHRSHPDLLTLVVTGDGGLDSAIRAIRAGAYDYITKPIDVEALVISIERAVAHVKLGRELRRLQGEVASARPLADIVGESAAVRRMVAMVRKVSGSDTTVLIVGESGTGKELVARAIHDGSALRDRPFVAINCAALPPTLLESELFGHVKGAFTDARRSRPGLFQQAGAGTLFLDEIGEMPLEMQVKLLRVLQERRVRPVGGDEEVAVEARVITATNRSLEADVADKRFREDLYYRINVVQVDVPPLRARPGDVLILAQHFIRKIAARTGKAVVGIAAEAARILVEYDWPGNVRELENTIERAIALTSVNEICANDLPDRMRDRRRLFAGTAPGRSDELLPLAQVEDRYIRQVLQAVGGNKTLAAKILGIDRRSLYRRLDESAGVDSDPTTPR